MQSPALEKITGPELEMEEMPGPALEEMPGPGLQAMPNPVFLEEIPDPTLLMEMLNPARLEKEDAALLDGLRESASRLGKNEPTHVLEELPATWPIRGVSLSERVNVSVYLGVVDSGSRRFVAHQLFPALHDVGLIINYKILNYRDVEVSVLGLALPSQF